MVVSVHKFVDSDGEFFEVGEGVSVVVLVFENCDTSVLALM